MNINVSTNWYQIILDQTKLPYWKLLADNVDYAYNHHVVFPKKENIFACFNYFNFEDTKVVIIGQDPYYKPNQANGLAFSVNRHMPLPKSLINIFSELESDLKIKRTNGDLSDWAKQGILLINTCLTVNENEPESHIHFGWNIFTDNIIKYIDQNLENVIFVLMGNHAKAKIPLINNNRNHIVSCAHPSPLSAYHGFFGSKIFSRINNLLKSMNKQTINW